MVEIFYCVIGLILLLFMGCRDVVRKKLPFIRYCSPISFVSISTPWTHWFPREIFPKCHMFCSYLCIGEIILILLSHLPLHQLYQYLEITLPTQHSHISVLCSGCEWSEIFFLVNFLRKLTWNMSPLSRGGREGYLWIKPCCCCKRWGHSDTLEGWQPLLGAGNVAPGLQKAGPHNTLWTVQLCFLPRQREKSTTMIIADIYWVLRHCKCFMYINPSNPHNILSLDKATKA